jgi:transcriptional regulator with XRE-family HTH domain
MQSLGFARRLLGIPLSDLAARAGLSVREVSRIERGDVRPKPATLEALDAAFVALVLARVNAECRS